MEKKQSIEKTRDVSRIPSVNENVMILTEGYKHCGTVRKVLSSYVERKWYPLPDSEYYTIECVETDCIEFCK